MPFVQASANSGGVLNLTGATAGNALLIGVVQNANGSRTYSVADDIDGAYGAADLNFAAANKNILFFSLFAITGGDPTITVTQSGGAAVGFRCIAIEASNLDSGATPITGSIDNSAVNADNHFSAAAGSIDTTTATFVITAGVLTSTSGVSSTSAGATYTKLDLGNLAAFLQYKDAPTALTDDRGAWTSTGTDRPDVSAMIAYPEIVSSFDPATNHSWRGTQPERVPRQGRRVPSGVLHIRGPKAVAEAQAYLRAQRRRYAFLTAA